MKRRFISRILAVVIFLNITNITLPMAKVYAAPNELTLEEVVQNIQEYDSKIEYNMEKLNEYKEEIIEKEKQIEENEKQLEEAQKNVDQKDKQLADRLKLIQATGGLEVTPMIYLEALFNSGNILDAIDKINAISKICSNDKKLINDAKAAQEDITNMRKDIEKQNEELKKNKQDIEDETKGLEEEKEKLLEYVKENSYLLDKSGGILVPVTLQSDTSEEAKLLIDEAQKYLKVPYVWGGTTPDGFDCSGLMQYVFNSQGISIPRTSQEQQKFAKTISMAQIKPGDLVFNKPSDSTHVGMYIGNDMYIQAPHTGDVVKISKLSESNMKYVGRVLNH